MASIEEYHEMWGKDALIDQTRLSLEAANIPFLHHKYYVKYSQEDLKLKKYYADYERLKRDKDLYYRGILDPEELKALGWKPNAKSYRPGEIAKAVETDEDIINMSLKIGYQATIKEMLADVLKMINGRSYQIKNIIDILKFENGGY